MAKLICTKNGEPYVPERNVLYEDYILYNKVQEIIENTKHLVTNPKARVELKFINNNVSLHAYDCENEFVDQLHNHYDKLD